MKLTRRFSNTLQNYQRNWLADDLMAGIVVAILVTPQSIAYALLAGLPPQAGLYAALLPVAIYAFLGSSPLLAVGPVAIISLMTFEALHQLARSEEHTSELQSRPHLVCRLLLEKKKQ